MTITIPAWVFWVLGIAAGLGIIALALLGLWSMWLFGQMCRNGWFR